METAVSSARTWPSRSPRVTKGHRELPRQGSDSESAERAQLGHIPAEHHRRRQAAAMTSLATVTSSVDGRLPRRQTSSSRRTRCANCARRPAARGSRDRGGGGTSQKTSHATKGYEGHVLRRPGRPWILRRRRSRKVSRHRVRCSLHDDNFQAVTRHHLVETTTFIISGIDYRWHHGTPPPQCRYLPAAVTNPQLI